MARISYDLQLKELKNEMLLLGSMIEEAISNTINSLVNCDVEKAKEIAANDGKINEQVLKIENICYNLLLKQQPIAKDLREVSAALKMITDMERIGDHGADISEIVVIMGETEYPKEIKLIKEMAKATTCMVIEAVDAFSSADEEKAQYVIEKDDVVDDLFMQFKTSITQSIQNGTANADVSLDLFMIVKYFERIGDHATNIAEWVKFSVTGELPED